MFICYTYIYLDPRKPGTYQYGDYKFDYEPFYVGKGKSKQYISHLNEAKMFYEPKKFMNSHKFYKIKNILNENLEPIILKVEDNISEQEAFELEIYLIWSIGRFDLNLGPLTNHTAGGDGTIGFRHSEESKMRVSRQHKGKETPDHVKKILSEKAKGRKFTPSHIINLSKSHKGIQSGSNHPLFGIPRSKETKRKISDSLKERSMVNKNVQHFTTI